MHQRKFESRFEVNYTYKMAPIKKDLTTEFVNVPTKSESEQIIKWTSNV